MRWSGLEQLSLLYCRRRRRTKAQAGWAGWRHRAFNCRGVVEVKLANWSSLRPMWSSHRLGNWQLMELAFSFSGAAGGLLVGLEQAQARGGGGLL